MKIPCILSRGITTLLSFAPLFTQAAQDTLTGTGGATQPGVSWADTAAAGGTIGVWSLGGIPGAGDNAIISATGLVDVRGSALGGSTTFQDLTFSSTAAVTLNNNSSSSNMLLILNGGRGAGAPLISTVGDFAYAITGPGSNGTPRPLALRLDASGDFSVAANVLTISAVIGETGAQSINKTGAGRLTLSGANTYTGGTTVTAGVLEVTNANSLSTGTTVVNGGTLEVNFANATLNTASVSVNAGGQIALRNLTLNKVVTLNGGTLATRTGDLSNFAGGVEVTAASSVMLRSFTTPVNDQSISIGGLLSGSGSLTINGNASNATSGKALILTNTGNIYGGAFIVNAGQTLRSAPATTGNTLGAANVNLNGGILQLLDDGAGSDGVIGYGNDLAVLTGAGTVNVDRVAVNTGNVFQLGTLTQGAQTLNVTGANGYGLRVGAVTLVGDATFNPTTAPLHISGPVSGAFGFTKTGAGNLTLSAANAFSGRMNVNAGTLILTGTVANAAQIDIGAGAILDASSGGLLVGGPQILSGAGSVTGSTVIGNGGGIEPGDALGAGALALQNLTFGTASSDTATVRVHTAGTPSRINVSGVLTAIGGAGSIAFDFIGGLPVLGQQPLIDYTGSIGGMGFSAFTLGALPNRVTATLVDNTAGSSIDLNVTFVDSVVWTGAAGSTWSTATLASPKNWTLLTAASPTDYLNGDSVRFDDSATTTTADVSAADVISSGIIFDNTAKDFAITGSKAIRGIAAFTKNGTGRVTVSTVNSFTGAVTLNAGTVSVPTVADGGANSALGAGAAIVFNGGTLDFTGASGSTNRAVTINAGGAFVETNTALTLTGAISGPGPLTKLGTGTLTLTNAAIDYANTNIAAGTLQFGNGGTVGGPGSAMISNEGTLAFNHANAKTVNNVINGSGALTKTGSGMLTLGGPAPNTYSGLTTVTGGLLLASKTADITAIQGNLAIGTGGIFRLGANNQIADTANVVINGGTFGDPTTATPANPGPTDTVASVTVNGGAFGSNRNPAGFTINGLLKVTAGTALAQRGGIIRANSAEISGTGVLNLDGGSTTFGGESRLDVGPGGLILAGGFVHFNTGPSTLTAASQGSILNLAGNLTSTGTSAFVRQNAAIAGPKAVLDLGGLARTFNVEGTLDIGTSAAPVTVTNGTVEKTGGGILSLNGPQTYTTLTTSAGTTNLNVALGTGTSTVNADATTNFGVSQTLAALNVGAGAVAGAPAFVVVPEPGVPGLLMVGALGMLVRRRKQRCG